MLFKKYRIGPVGKLLIKYKRIESDPETYLCSMCGLGGKCKELYPVAPGIPFSSLCQIVYKLPSIEKQHSAGGLDYIPWSLAK